MSLVDLRGVRYRYAGASDWALNGVDLTVGPGEVVHFGLVGGEEQVGGCAFPDLAGEEARRAEVEPHGVARGFLVGGSDFPQRVGQAGRGKNDNFACGDAAEAESDCKSRTRQPNKILKIIHGKPASAA